MLNFHFNQHMRLQIRAAVWRAMTKAPREDAVLLAILLAALDDAANQTTGG